MARMSGLGGLLEAVEAEKSAPAAVPADVPAATPIEKPVTAVVAAAPATKKPNAPRRPAKPAAPKQETAVGEGPRYLELTRKEARFREDQLDDLTVLTRRLNKDRRGSGERLTDNTLIRVAVDLLLAQQDKLAGSTEDELRKSVGL